ISAEAYNALKEWMDFRAYYGETTTGESWLMRDIWQTTNIDYGAKSGLATCPKKLKSSGIKRLLERALWEQGVRHPLQNGAKRHEYIIRGKLEEKDEQIKNLSEKFNSMQSMLEKVITATTQVQNPQQFSAMAQSLFTSGVLKMEEKIKKD